MQHCAIFRNRKNAKRRERKNTGQEPGLKGAGSGRFKPPCPPPPRIIRSCHGSINTFHHLQTVSPFQTSETIARILQPYSIRTAHKPISILRQLLTNVEGPSDSQGAASAHHEPESREKLKFINRKVWLLWMLRLPAPGQRWLALIL